MRDVRSLTTRVNQHEGSLDTLLKRAPSRYDGSGAADTAAPYRAEDDGRRFHGYGGPSGAGSYDGSLGWPLGAAPSRAPERPGRASLPLALGPLGALATGRTFDDRVSIHVDFRFKGAKGDVWKGNIERYFFSRVPAVYELCNWAEKEEGPITDEHREAVGAA